MNRIRIMNYKVNSPINCKESAMRKPISLLVIALVCTPLIATAQDVDVTKKKSGNVQKSEGTCCATDKASMKKEVRVTKEKNADTGAMVTKVTIRMVKDGVEEVKTLQGAEAEAYLQETERESDNEEVEVKKIIKKKVTKEEKK
jgi:hypothetical protein